MKISEYLSKEEIAYFTAKSDWHAWRLFLANWLAIAAIFAAVAAFPNPLTILVAVILLAGRQLGLSVLMHEAGHRSLFRTPYLNDFLGQWFCALPVFSDMPSYAKGHLVHHQNAGSHDDPDLPNYQAYPISKASLRRKALRDFSGQTGLKFLANTARGASGVMSRTGRGDARPFQLQLLAQLSMITVLALCGIAWVYLLWLAAFLTVFMFIIRVRQVAEHAAVPDLYDSDPRMNTRTVDAPWWQRILFAPNGVNFHMEHHFMASVPCYRLKELREHLRCREVLVGVPVFRGYGELLRHAVGVKLK
jgi:fatty acid desaturase